MSLLFFFFKQKTAYEMRISDWSSDVCSSDLIAALFDDLESRVGAFAELLAGGDSSFEALLTAHVAAAEALAEADDESGAARLRAAGRRSGTGGVRTCRARWALSY